MQELEVKETVAVQRKDVVESEVVEIPKKWGMNTPPANQTMTRKAQTLVNNVVKVEGKNGSYVDYLSCLERYFQSYDKTCVNNKICSEGKGEEVSANVYNFAKEVAKAVNVSESTLQDIWQKR